MDSRPPGAELKELRAFWNSIARAWSVAGALVELPDLKVIGLNVAETISSR